MKYGARAILWAHKIFKGKVAYRDAPKHLKAGINRYLIDHDMEEYIYTADTVTFKASVTLVGDTITDSMFTFSLTDGDELTLEASNVGNSITFEDIEYSNQDVDQTFEYTITQDAGEADGYIYDASEYVASVDVFRSDVNPNNVEYELTITKTKDESGTSLETPVVVDKITFVNQYQESDD